jgi:UDP-3-O-acyl-N-acetylglucosamine deacetylase
MIEFSARTFVNQIRKVGTKTTTKETFVIVVKKDIFFEFENSYTILRPSLNGKTNISALIQFPEPIGDQYFQVQLSPEIYERELSWARSFIRANCDKKYWKNARKSVPCLPRDLEDSPIPLFENQKWVIKPVVADEPVRHKLLDSIGDLSVLGYPIIGNVTFIRPGHRFNYFLVKYLSSLVTTDK